MTALSPYKMSGSYDYVLNGNMPPQQVSESAPQTFFLSWSLLVKSMRSLHFLI